MSAELSPAVVQLLPDCAWCGRKGARGRDMANDPCCARGVGCGLTIVRKAKRLVAPMKCAASLDCRNEGLHIPRGKSPDSPLRYCNVCYPLAAGGARKDRRVKVTA